MEEPVETRLPPTFATALPDLPDTGVKSAETFAWKTLAKMEGVVKVVKTVTSVSTAAVLREHGVRDARKMSTNATTTPA